MNECLNKKSMISNNSQNLSETSISVNVEVAMVCMYFLCMCVTPPDQTGNDIDLKFGTHTHLDHI